MALCTIACACGTQTDSKSPEQESPGSSDDQDTEDEGDDDESDSSSSSASVGDSDTAQTSSDPNLTASPSNSEDAQDTSGSTAQETPRKSFVDFVAVYEPGSAWERHPEAKEAVEEMFSQLEATIKTSGDWDTEIEVYFTDDNTANANVRFLAEHAIVEHEGKALRVVPAWNKIVRNAPDENGSGKTDGSSADFIMHFNVEGHQRNPGLVRHEIMHGLGAVSQLVRPVMDPSGEIIRRPIVGQRWIPGPYELRLVDRDGSPLLEDYDAESKTYAIREFRLEADFETWQKGDGGLAFRGIDARGESVDMPCMTFPTGESGENARIRYEEPEQLMSARAHPTWHTISDIDRAFLRALGYELRDLKRKPMPQ